MSLTVSLVNSSYSKYFANACFHPFREHSHTQIQYNISQVSYTKIVSLTLYEVNQLWMNSLHELFKVRIKLQSANATISRIFTVLFNESEYRDFPKVTLFIMCLYYVCEWECFVWEAKLSCNNELHHLYELHNTNTMSNLAVRRFPISRFRSFRSLPFEFSSAKTISLVNRMMLYVSVYLFLYVCAHVREQFF